MSALAIIANIIVPGAGLAIHYLPQIANFVIGINGRCDQLGQNQAHFRRVSDRLHEILMQLTAMHDKGQLPSPQVVKRYAELLDDFDVYLTKYLKSNFVCRLLTQDEVGYKITIFHNEVDELLKLLNLAHIAQMTDWRLQYELDQREEAAKWTNLVATNRLLMEECVNARLQHETMLRLLHEIHQKKPASFQSKLVLQAYQTLQRLSHQPELKIPSWFIPPEEVSIQGIPFARGSSADVYKGIWRQTAMVIVKCFHNSTIAEHEISLWSRLHHPNILHLYGGCHVGQQSFALCEEAEKGTLDTFLQATEISNRREVLSTLLTEATAGLEYLHAMNIVHGDIKCNNLLVTELHHLKLSDFGCALDTRKSPEHVHASKAYRWIAPECITQGSKPTFASDIYAFGLTILEAFTQNVPFAHLSDEAKVRGAICNGDIPSIPNEPEWSEIVRKCCTYEPNDRLSLRDFMVQCQELAASISPTEPSATTTLSTPPELQEKIDSAIVNTVGNVSTREYGYGLVAEKTVLPEKPKKSKRKARRCSSRRVSVSNIDGLINDIPELLKWLERPITSDTIKEKLLQALLNHPEAYSTVLTHGGVSILIHIVAKGSTPTLKELSTAVLALYARGHSDVAAAIRSGEGLSAIVKLLRVGTFGQKKLALRALASLTSTDDEICLRLLDDTTSIGICVEMIKYGGEQQQEESLCLAANLANCKVHPLVLGTWSYVIEAIESISYTSQLHCFRLIINILHGSNNNSIVPIASRLIPLVVTQFRLHLTDIKMVEYLVQILGLLAFHNDDFCISIVDAGAIPLLWSNYNSFPTLRSIILITLSNVATSVHHRRLLSRNNAIHTVLKAMSCNELYIPCIHLLHNIVLETCLLERILELGAVEIIMNGLLVHVEDSSVAIKTLALLSTIDKGLDYYSTSGVIAWCVTQLAFAPNIDSLCILLQNCVVNASCLDVFIMTSGIAVALKRLTKAVETNANVVPLLGLLANVAVSLDNVQLLAENEATLYILMRLVKQCNSKQEQIEALRCVANITLFEPSVLRVVKGSGVPILLPLLVTKTICTVVQNFALDIILHMAYFEGFHVILRDRTVVSLFSSGNLNSMKCSRIRTLLGLPEKVQQKVSLLRSLWRIVRVKEPNNQESNDISVVLLVKSLECMKSETMENILCLLNSDTAADSCIEAGIIKQLPRLLRTPKSQSSAIEVVQKLLDHCSEKYYKQLAIDSIMKPLLSIANNSNSCEDKSYAIQVVLTLANINGAQSQILHKILPQHRNTVYKCLLDNQSEE
ncbi:kinase [Thraustotheca clavata]|uniref:Kinase n=1 Tax=Thraustotheca clavata TaxID=74557 RepID=A0A1V9Z0S8_9STRA|nr:kinase [Thraustotheca clavata]